MGGACSTYGSEEKCLQGFGGETWGERAIWKTRRRWEDSIKMDLKDDDDNEP
jgi:hypothetical protein